MRMILLVALMTAAGCNDDDPPVTTPDAPAAELQCVSSTLPETGPHWDACRDADINSWPVFCEGGAMPTACDFEAPLADGGVAICRLPGGCDL